MSRDFTSAARAADGEHRRARRHGQRHPAPPTGRRAERRHAGVCPSHTRSAALAWRSRRPHPLYLRTSSEF